MSSRLRFGISHHGAPKRKVTTEQDVRDDAADDVRASKKSVERRKTKKEKRRIRKKLQTLDGN